jgi:exodeoxyribonuclease V alpha subunit
MRLSRPDQTVRNPPVPSPALLEHLCGRVERVTFHNAANGFCVLRLNVKGERDLVAPIVYTRAVTPGKYAPASGHWLTDGEQGG